MFAAEIRKRRVAHMRCYPQWRWHLDEMFVKINGKVCYLWRAVDHEGEVLEAVVSARRDKAAALKLLKRIMKKYGAPRNIVTDGLRGLFCGDECDRQRRSSGSRWPPRRRANSNDRRKRVRQDRGGTAADLPVRLFGATSQTNLMGFSGDTEC